MKDIDPMEHRCSYLHMLSVSWHHSGCLMLDTLSPCCCRFRVLHTRNTSGWRLINNVKKSDSLKKWLCFHQVVANWPAMKKPKRELLKENESFKRQMDSPFRRSVKPTIRTKWCIAAMRGSSPELLFLACLMCAGRGSHLNHSFISFPKRSPSEIRLRTGCPVMKSAQDKHRHSIYRNSFHIAGDMFNFPGKSQGHAIWDEMPQQPFHVAKITGVDMLFKCERGSTGMLISHVSETSDDKTF